MLNSIPGISPNSDPSLCNENKLSISPVVLDDRQVEFGPQWRQFGVKVSPPNCAPLGLDATSVLKTLPCATFVSNTRSPGFFFSEKSPFEDFNEHRTQRLLEEGLHLKSQQAILNSWKNGEFLSFATKYKPVAKKIHPVNQPMPLDLNPPLKRCDTLDGARPTAVLWRGKGASDAALLRKQTNRIDPGDDEGG